MKTKNFIFTIIRLALVVALVAAIFFFVFRKPAPSNVPFSHVSEAVLNAIETDGMEQNTFRFLKKYFNLNAEDYEDVLICTPTTSMNAEEIVLIKLKDSSQEDEIRKAIEARVEAKMTAFDGYAPEQYELSKNYLLDVSGGYVLYVVSPDAQKIDDAFKKAL